MKKSWIVLAGVVAAPLFLLYCGNKEPTIPTSPQGNQAPVIRSLTIDPTEIPAGGSARVIVDAIDPEGEALEVAWSAGAGAIAGGVEGVYTHDGGNTTSDIISVTVTDPEGSGTTQQATIVIHARPQNPADGPGGGPSRPNPDPTSTPVPPDDGPCSTPSGPDPTSPPSATPTPVPTSTPTPTPTPIPPPTVTLGGGGSCHPSCSVHFTASGTNYTTLSWGGCCSGSGSRSSCPISSPGTVTCTVTATGPGGSASASEDATGTNMTPDVRDQGIYCGGDCLSFMDGEWHYSVNDDDVQLSEQDAGASGPCHFTGSSPGVVRFRTDRGPGNCVVGVTVCDPWGACGQSYGYFNVPAP